MMESPVYAILKMNDELAKLDTCAFGGDGSKLKIYKAVLPFSDQQPSMKWDGEWHITIEVFRDLGLAFAAVLVLIYILMVGWFKSFLTPLIVMTVILTDPIFQGLAIALMAGSLISMFTAPVLVPLPYFMAFNRKKKL